MCQCVCVSRSPIPRQPVGMPPDLVPDDLVSFCMRNVSACIEEVSVEVWSRCSLHLLLLVASSVRFVRAPGSCQGGQECEAGFCVETISPYQTYLGASDHPGRHEATSIERVAEIKGFRLRAPLRIFTNWNSLGPVCVKHMSQEMRC